MFIKPMLAAPFKADFEPALGEWFAEEKFDGHRLIVNVAPDGGDLFGNPTITAWSRNEIERLLPPHVRKELERLPSGIYDGELIVPGKRSYGVTELTNSNELVYTVFDILEIVGVSTQQHLYHERRAILEELFQGYDNAVRLATSTPVKSRAHALQLVQDVWTRDGEGLILKHRMSIYQPGKRSKQWIKLKALQSTVCTVIGYRDAQMGPQSIVVLEDEEGFQTKVKTLNDHERGKLEDNPELYVGRKLRIEFQERTKDGSYRHPRWDRWENE